MARRKYTLPKEGKGGFATWHTMPAAFNVSCVDLLEKTRTRTEHIVKSRMLEEIVLLLVAMGHHLKVGEGRKRGPSFSQK